MIIERVGLAPLLPHGGAMMLLDGVEFWDRQRIICVSMQHCAPGNPLRTRAGLSSLHGVEFAAQAAAAHGALNGTQSARPQTGLLLSVRDCRFHVRRLDTFDCPLRIESEQVGSSEGTRMYRFHVTARQASLVEGRLTVLLRGETSG